MLKVFGITAESPEGIEAVGKKWAVGNSVGKSIRLSSGNGQLPWSDIDLLLSGTKVILTIPGWSPAAPETAMRMRGRLKETVLPIFRQLLPEIGEGRLVEAIDLATRSRAYIPPTPRERQRTRDYYRRRRRT